MAQVRAGMRKKSCASPDFGGYRRRWDGARVEASGWAYSRLPFAGSEASSGSWPLNITCKLFCILTTQHL
eukprot:6204660-Pleurochrysis_carterae.AAC.2